MEEVKTNNNTDAKVVASLLGDSNNKVARYLSIVQQIHSVKKDIFKFIIINETSSALVPVTLPQGKSINTNL